MACSTTVTSEPSGSRTGARSREIRVTTLRTPASFSQMLHLRRACLLLLALLLFSVAPASPAWPHEQSDLPVNPSIRFGRLENGLRFVVQQNAEPRRRIALRLFVRVGSLHENEDELGLTHFVEHMAFSSTRRFPRNTLTEILQRHGLAFGADVSAFTFLTHTIYQLDVPVEFSRLDEGLEVLRDFADGQVFDSDEVTRERGVVESERRARDNWGARAGETRDRFLFPHSLISRRLPIGDATVLRNAGPAELRRFYEKWYRADNMVVIAVGDLTPDQLEGRVRAHFSSLVKPTTPLPSPPDLGPVSNPSEVEAHYHREPAAGAVTLELNSIAPGAGGFETAAARRVAMERDFVMTLMTERMNQLRRDNAREFGATHAITQPFGQHHTSFTLHIDCAALHWRTAVAALAREYRRATEQGFSEEEIAAGMRLIRRRFDYAVIAEATESSRTLADQLVFAFALDRVPSSWAQAKELNDTVLATMTPERARAVAREIWAQGAPRLFMLSNLQLADAANEIVSVFKSGLLGPLPPLPRPQPTTLAYAPYETAGTIRARSHVADLDIHLVEFANGVRLNLKRTDFNRNLIQVRARVGRGRLSQSKDLPGLALLAAPYLNDAGVGRHDNSELQRFTAERNLSLGFAAEPTAFTLTGASDRESLPDLLLLLQAYVSDPAWRPREFAAAHSKIISAYQEIQYDPASALNFLALRTISRDDPRLALPPYPQTASRTLSELMTWIEGEVHRGSIELGLVGDFDVEETIDRVARTLGALPRRPLPASTSSLKLVPFTRKAGTWTAQVDSPIPRALVRVQWPVSGLMQIRQQRVVDTVAGILQNRVRREIREKLGATYDPDSDLWTDDTIRDDGYLIITLSAHPQDASELAKLVARIAEDFRRNGATLDDLHAEIEPRIAENPTRLRNNSYWLYHIVTPAQSEPFRLDWPRTREADLRSITLKEVNAAAAKFLHGNRAQIFVATPRR